MCCARAGSRNRGRTGSCSRRMDGMRRYVSLRLKRRVPRLESRLRLTLRWRQSRRPYPTKEMAKEMAKEMVMFKRYGRAETMRNEQIFDLADCSEFRQTIEARP